MRQESSDCLPTEITYSILKPFLAGADQDSLELPPYFEIDPRNGVSNRSVAVHVVTRVPSCRGRTTPRPFDEIEFSLHGVIKSEVGSKIARRKILHSVELRRWSDFNKHHRGKNIPSHQLGEEYYCDINFRIDSTYGSDHGTVAQLLPSMSIESSKYVTQSTALHDQHRVSGNCEVIYWIEARYAPSTRFAGVADTSVRAVSSSALSLKPTPNRVCLVSPRTLRSRKEESRCLQVEAKSSNTLRMKRQCQALFSGVSRQDQVQPRFMFGVQDSSTSEYTLLATSASTSTFVVPLTMTVFIPPTATSSSSCDALRRHLTSSGFPNTITVASTWDTNYKFTTKSIHTAKDEDIIEKHTVVREVRVPKFPPFYQSTGSQYTATIDLEITVPAGLPVTSDTGLLVIQHLLSIGIKIGEEEKSSPHPTATAAAIYAAGMAADMRLECLVET